MNITDLCVELVVNIIDLRVEVVGEQNADLRVACCEVTEHGPAC